MRHVRSALTALMALSAATLLACGGGGGGGPTYSSPPPPPAGNSSDVTVVNNSFDPASTTVSVGTKVVWTWNSGGVTHNVTFNDGPTSGNKSNGTYERTFSTAGTYDYHCTIHGAAMSGSVKVQ
jgi:plastocyanin